ncbi:unnamed protein product [Moneuplotes crassus]|uniref:BZIP domain-containing protein n=1 Tax=Euplotes crassus TaxID=5936 RepID=A0AAD1XPF1_EUPCR|nr:unnamed protein product [Moneuplotes crassus]
MNRKRNIKERAKKEQTLSAKERSKIHRERKKKYYEDLERRVHELEEENRKLKATIQISSNASPTTDPLAQLLREENFMYCGLPKVISQNPEQFRMSMFETCRESEGPNGSCRVQVLKNSFNKIINNCMSLNYKVSLAILNHFESKKIFEIARDKTRNDRSQYKYYRADSKDQGMGKESSDGTDNESNHRYIISSLLYKYPFSEKLIERWINISPKTEKFCFTMRKLVKSLIRVRNRMLRTMKEVHEVFFESKMYEGFDKQDVANYYSLCNDFKGTEVLDPLYLFQLNPKSPDDEDYRNDEISCTEN